MVEDTSTPGTGAILRPITNEKITDVIVINQGIGYDGNSTSVYIKSRGFGAKFDTRVRYLDVNDAEKLQRSPGHKRKSSQISTRIEV